jgi:hypothetical protein
MWSFATFVNVVADAEFLLGTAFALFNLSTFWQNVERLP